jgi:hypothetical protein
MRAEDELSGSLFSYVDLEARVGQNRPLRAIRAIVNETLAALAGDFSALYSPIGRCNGSRSRPRASRPRQAAGLGRAMQERLMSRCI